VRQRNRFVQLELDFSMGFKNKERVIILSNDCDGIMDMVGQQGVVEFYSRKTGLYLVKFPRRRSPWGKVLILRYSMYSLQKVALSPVKKEVF